MRGNKSLLDAKRIVVKVGSTTITHGTGKLNYKRIDGIAAELADLVNQGKEVVLVTSGAVAAGMGRMGLQIKPTSIPEKQAAAAVGQGVLMHTYEKLFGEYGQIVAQVLLTRADAVDRHHYANCRNTFLALLSQGIIPIVNENDVVSIDELKIGDNDNLSAMVAGIIDADLLILLSDIDALYTANPQTNPDATPVREVQEITQAIVDSAGGAGSNVGTGGMATKIQAAKAANSSGINMVICSGFVKGNIAAVLEGEEIGTLFVSKENKLHLRKKWLAFGARVQGSIVVDAGCEAALSKDGACSILPAGVLAVDGTYEIGNTISIVNAQGHELARGITNFSASDIELIKGKQTTAIESILGEKHYNEIVHRDNLVVL